jgi:hypothetical protein
MAVVFFEHIIGKIAVPIYENVAKAKGKSVRELSIRTRDLSLPLDLCFVDDID